MRGSKQASTSIDDPAFVNMWNLLDLVSIFSDNGSLVIRLSLGRPLSNFRYPVYRTMRSWPYFLANRRAPRQPDSGGMPEGV